MRFFFSGDEELSRRFLPIISSKAKAFEDRLVRSNKKQGTYSDSIPGHNVSFFFRYYFGQLDIIVDAPVSSQQKKIVKDKKYLYEWNFIYSIGEVNGGAFGAFFSTTTAFITRFRAAVTATEIGSISSDDSLYYDESDDGEPARPPIYSNNYIFDGISKTLLALLSRYNFTTTYSILALENFDIVHSAIWTTTGYNPYRAADKGNVISFFSGGDFVDEAIVESIVQYEKTAYVSNAGRYPIAYYNRSYFYIDSFFGELGAIPYIVKDWYSKGMNIFAEFIGGQSLASETTTALYIDYTILYEISIRISRVINGVISTSDVGIMNHEFSPYVDSLISFVDSGTTPPSRYPACMAMRPYCAPRNVVFIYTEITPDSGVEGDFKSCLFASDLMSPTGMPLYQLAANLFVVSGSSILYGTTNAKILIDNIKKWSYDGRKFLYIEQNFSINASACISIGSFTGKLIFYIVTNTPDIVAGLTINDYTSSTIFWHSKNFDVIVVKGTSSQDGVYKLSGSTYSKIADFTDEEPVFLSDNGEIIALKGMMFVDGVAFTCNECVGVFFDGSGYVDRGTDGIYRIYGMTGNLIEAAPSGYNFHELSEDSSICIISSCYQSPASAFFVDHALVVDFADGPAHFEKCDKVMTQEVTTIRRGRRYTGDVYVKPPWAIHFGADDTIARIRSKTIAVAYNDSYSFRSDILNNYKRRHKHLWHHKLGVMERLYESRPRIPEDLLCITTERIVEA